MKNKKGFTLIELLAVIIVLAIIILIAAPKVVDIIENSKRNLNLRSAYFYLDAVELSLAQAKQPTLTGDSATPVIYYITKEGHICPGNLDSNGNCDEDVIKVEVNGTLPKSGKISVVKGKVSSASMKLNEESIVTNSEGNLVYPVLSELCTLESGKANTVGSKYKCDFGDGERNFYVLESWKSPAKNSLLKDDEVALILEGTYDTNKFMWYASQTSGCIKKDYIPVDTKLDEIAEKWVRVERNQIVLPSAYQIATVIKNSPSYSGLDPVTRVNNGENVSLNVAPWLYGTLDYLTSTYRTTPWYVGGDGKMATTGNKCDRYTVRPVVNIKL